VRTYTVTLQSASGRTVEVRVGAKTDRGASNAALRSVNEYSAAREGWRVLHVK
jgi:hypothetical protein